MLSSRQRRVVLALGFALCASCATDVVLATLASPSTDGGPGPSDGGAARDGGFAGPGDAGTDSGGTADAGTGDGGLPDAGASDGGGDAGAADAGPDGGMPDASLPDLDVSFVSFDWVVEVDAGTASFNVIVQNGGTDAVAGAALALRTPLGLQFQSVGSCTVADAGSADAGLIVCPSFSLLPQAVQEHPIDVVLPSTLRSYVFVATVTSAAPEASLANNTARFALAVTPPGRQPLVLADGGTLAITYCAGTNITSFAQCVVGSRITDTFWLFPDGGWDFDDPEGSPLMGPWGQPRHGRSVAFGFAGAAPGDLDGTWVGAAVDGGCFEGVFQTGGGRAYAGAWQGCLQ